MPIVAEGDEEPNNTYVEQLTASARAAVQVGPPLYPPPPPPLPRPPLAPLVSVNCLNPSLDWPGQLQPFETSTV